MAAYCGDRHLGEELAQEAFARAWERWGRSDVVIRQPEGWLFRTAINLANSRFRRLPVERRARHRLAASVDSSDPSNTAEAVALRMAIAELPGRQRSVIVARFLLGLDVAQTAEVLGIAAGTVKSTTSDALRRLRAMDLTDEREREVSHER